MDNINCLGSRISEYRQNNNMAQMKREQRVGKGERSR